MARVKIKSLHLENYKSVGNLTVYLSDRSQISGKNATGKSTVAGAIIEVLTGKLPNGSEATDEILRPVVNGVRVDRVPIVRELTVDVDGRDYVIRKETVQKWTRHKGDSEETFSGNENKYSIDGFDLREKDYIAWLNEHICDTEKLLYCMNPQIFLNTLAKSTADARMALEKASGFSLENFILENPQYADIDKLTCGQPIEKALKKYRADLNKQKKDLTASQNNLSYEQNKKIEELPVDDIADLEEQIKETQASLNLVTERNEKHKEITIKLSMLRNQLFTEKKRDEEKAHTELDSASRNVLSLQEDIHDTERKIERENFNYNSSASSIASFESLKKNMVTRLKESEESKPEGDSFVCKFCGQMLPLDMVAEVNTKFEEEKEKEISGCNAAIEYYDRMIEDINKNLETIKANIEALNEKKANLKKEFAQAVNSYNQMKTMPRPVSEEVTKLEKEIADLEATEKTIAGYDGEIEAGKKHIEELTYLLNKAKSNQRTNETLIQNHNESVNQLMVSVKQNAQACADVERIIDKLMMFGRQKNEKLAELVNPYFSYLHFSFVGYTQDGSPYDDCKIVSNFDKIDYRNTNHGYRLLTEMDLVNGLQKLNGVTLPVICDDTESLDSERIPKFDNQLILVRRTDEVGINVKEI